MIAFAVSISIARQAAFREHCVGMLRHVDGRAELERAVSICGPSARSINELCLIDAVSARGDVAGMEWLVGTFGLTDRGVAAHGCDPLFHAATHRHLNATAWLATRFLDCDRAHCVESPRVQRAMLAYCRWDDVVGAQWFIDYYNINLARGHHWADHNALLSACSRASSSGAVRRWVASQASQFNAEA